MPEIVPTYTAAQVAAAEEPLLAAGEPLMARAADALARVCAAELPPRGGRVLVLAGRGNNGGDALFAAASLCRDHDVDILLVAEHGHEAGLAAATAAGARLVDAAEAEEVSYDQVIDGVLGIGTRGAPSLRGVTRQVVAGLLPTVEGGRTRVVAVDLPSGLHPDDGTSVDGLVLPATVTVTFGAVKAGLARERGPELAGRVVLVRLGLEQTLSGVEPVAGAAVDEVVDG